MKNAALDSAWRWATGILWLALAVALLATMSDYGMSWDEMTRWQSGDKKLEYYETVVQSEGFSAWGSSAGNDLYPGLFDLPLAVYAKYVGGNRVEAGHLYTIFFSLLAVISAGMIARELGDWRWAFWASLLITVLPRFYGHMVFNPKDIPFAATYSWGLWGVLRCAKGFPERKLSRWLLAGFFAGLAMSTRLPGVIILVYLGGLAVYRLFTCMLPKPGERWRPPPWQAWADCIGGMFLAVLVAGLVLIVFFPSSHQNPFADSVRVVSKLHDFSKSIPVLFRGEVFDAGTTPWYYVPWMIGITTPAWQLWLLLGGIGGGFWRVGNAFRRHHWWDIETIRMGTVLLGFSFPLIYLLIKQPAIHNGVRHFLFIYPSAAVLMAIGLIAITDSLWQRWKVRPGCVYIALVFAVALNITALVRLHPYQYVYFNNLVGGPAATLGQYETEYWFTSMGEGIKALQQWRREQGKPDQPVRVLMTGPREIAEFQLPAGWTLVRDAKNADYFLGNTQFAGHLLVEGRELFQIERMGLPILVVKELSDNTDERN